MPVSSGGKVIKKRERIFSLMPLLCCAAFAVLSNDAAAESYETALREKTEKKEGGKKKAAAPKTKTETHSSETFETNAGAGGDMLREVVITAAGFEQTLRDAPASISVIRREEIEKGAFRDLTDALTAMQGVTVTGNAGKQDIFMRGLPGNYTLLLVDGKRQSTRETRANGSAGFEQSFIPPANAIERIEVIRGPMSSLYGSDAMGGVINIITRKVPQKWGGSMTLDGTANQYARYGNTAQSGYYLAGPLAADILGLQLWGRSLQRAEDEIAAGTPKKKEYDFNGRLTLTPNENNEFNFEGGKTQLRRYADVGKTIENSVNNRRPATDNYNKNSREHWSGSYVGHFAAATAELSVLHENAKRSDYNRAPQSGNYTKSARAPHIGNTVYDGKLTAPFSLFGAQKLVTGWQYMQARLTDQNPGLRDNRNYRFGINQWALFGEDEWWLNDVLAVTGGLRYDRHEIYGGHWSPRGYLVWRATENLTLKGGISTGFRAPDIRDIAPGYAYTTGGGNCYYGRNPPKGRNRCAVIISDNNLKPEKSTGYEFSVLWERDENLQLGATFFYTDFRDKLADRQIFDTQGKQVEWEKDPNYVVYKNMNIDRSKLQGAELTADWKPTENLALRANYTYTDSKQKTGDYKGLPLARTPKNMANLRADWQSPIEKLTPWSALAYHGKETNAGFRVGANGKPVRRNGKIVARKYDDYLTADIGAAYKLNANMQFNAAIYNLFNKRIGAERFNDVAEGRRFWASLTANF